MFSATSWASISGFLTSTMFSATLLPMSFSTSRRIRSISVPPLPMRFAPVSPICPNEPARLVKSSTLIGPSAVRNAPDSTRMSTISASHAPIPIFSLFSACFSLFAMSLYLLIPFAPPLIRQPLQNRRSAYTLRTPQARCAETAILLPHIRPGCDCPRRARPCRTPSARRTLP